MNDTTVSPLRPSIETVGQAVDAYLSRLKRRQRSEKTLDKYRPYLRALADWAGKRSPASLTTFELADGFLFGAWSEDFERRNGRTPSPQSIRGVVGAISGLYRYLTDNGFLVDEDGRPVPNPAPALKDEVPKIKQRPNDFLRRDEDEALLEMELPPHEEILLWFLRWTGLRLGEALSLRMSDVDLSAGEVYVRTSKTSDGIRTVPITPELRPRIIKWREHLKRRGVFESNGYFLCTTRAGAWKDKKTGELRKSSPGQPMKAQSVETTLLRVGQRANVDGRLTPHRLRRTYASHFLNHGMRLESVSKLLGHSSTAITERAYATLLPETIRAEMRSVLGA